MILIHNGGLCFECETRLLFLPLALLRHKDDYNWHICIADVHLPGMGDSVADSRVESRFRDITMNSTRRVAVLMGIDSAFGRELLRGINDYARRNGHWHLYFGHTPELAMLPTSEPWGVDGLIVYLGTRDDYRNIERMGLPAVNIGSAFDDLSILSVRPDNDAIGQAAAEHLISSGLSSFACVSLADHAGAQDRVRGFTRAVAAASPQRHFAGVISLEGRSPGPSHLPQLEAFLRGLPTPCGLFVFNDRFAQAVLEAARRCGLRIPDDIAMVSVDNDDLLCNLSNPQLSSVDSAADHVGFRAAAVLYDMMRGKKPPAGPVLIPHRGVITRRSSDVLAVNDPVVARALKYIRQEPPANLSIDTIVKGADISRRTLERRFAQVLGRSVYDEIRQRRMQHAKYLLSHTTLPMERVGEECGFCHLSHFSNAFAHVVGMRPTKYQQMTRVIPGGNGGVSVDLTKPQRKRRTRK